MTEIKDGYWAGMNGIVDVKQAKEALALAPKRKFGDESYWFFRAALEGAREADCTQPHELVKVDPLPARYQINMVKFTKGSFGPVHTMIERFTDPEDAIEYLLCDFLSTGWIVEKEDYDELPNHVLEFINSLPFIDEEDMVVWTSNCGVYSVYWVTPTQEQEDEIPQAFKRGNLLTDTLHNLSAEVIAGSTFDTRFGQGILHGVIGTLMAMTGGSFEEVVQLVVPYLPSNIHWNAVPQAYRDAFKSAKKS